MKLKNIELISTEKENDITCKRHSFTKKNAHWHTYYELELVVRGSGRHIINGVEYPFSTGDVFLLTPSDFHEFSLDEEGETYLVEIPQSMLPDEIIDLIIQPAGNLIAHPDAEDFATLCDIFLTLEKHYKKSDPVDSVLSGSLLAALLSLFISHTDRSVSESPNRKNPRLREILLYIQHSYKENITLASISARFFINKEYLCQLFKSEMGVTVTEYVRRLRLGHAARLVITTDMKSIDISEACGFNSVATFMRSFKEEYGVSPLKMRASHIAPTKR